MKDEKDKQIGLYIRNLREKANMSQEELASKINVSRHAISKWELGSHISSKEDIDNLGRVFNITPEVILYAGNKRYFIKNKIKLFFENTYKKIFIFLFILLLIYAAFMTYYFIHNYKSTKYYNIYLRDENEFFTIEDGYMLLTNDNLYFYIKPIFKIDESKIEYLKLYYFNTKDEKEYIVETKMKDKLKFEDYYGYNEYFDFDNIDYIIRNLYMEVTFVDESSISGNLVFDKRYENNKLFSKKLTSEKEGKPKKEEEVKDSELRQKIKNVSNKIMELENNNSITIDYKGKKYSIYDNGEIFDIIYNDNKIEITLGYYDLGLELFNKLNSTISKHDKEIYYYNLTDNICMDGYNCEDYEKDFKLFNEILDYILSL